MLAIPWYFTSIVGRPSLFAAIYAITTFMSLFWNLYAGTLIDKYPRKQIFIYVSLVCGIILLAVSATGYINGEVPLALAGLVFVTTMFNYNIHFGALYAFGQELSDPERYGKISSYLEIQNQSTSVISGAVAAVLLTGVSVNVPINIAGLVLKFPFDIPPWKLQDIFLFDGITYFISILLVSQIRYKPVIKPEVLQTSIVARIKDGLAWLRERPALMAFGSYSYSIFVVLMVEIFMLLPLYVHHHLERGADVFASSEVFYSLGAMMAGIFIRRLFGKTNIVYAIIVLMVVTTTGFYSVAFTKVTGIFYIYSFVLGITNAGTRVLRTTYLFSQIPNNIIGRANSVFNVINILLRSCFLLLFSLAWFGKGSNVTWAFFICGTFVLLSAALLMKNYRKHYRSNDEK